MDSVSKEEKGKIESVVFLQYVYKFDVHLNISFICSPER